jgi:hypothetical protein
MTGHFFGIAEFIVMVWREACPGSGCGWTPDPLWGFPSGNDVVTDGLAAI